MRIYVLSVSSSRLKVALAELTPPAELAAPPAEERTLGALASGSLLAVGETATLAASELQQAPPIQPQDGRLVLSLTRADVPLPSEMLCSASLDVDSVLDELLRETATWPRPDAVVTLAQWDDDSPTWATRSQVIRTEPQELAQAAEKLAAGAVMGARGLRLAIAWAEALAVPLLTVPLPQQAELPAEARETGIPGLRREPRFHVLNSEMAAREAAFAVGQRFSEVAVVAAHLGSTSSVTAYQAGRVVSTTGSGLTGGPMGLRQAGPVSPATLQRLWAERGLTASSGAWAEFWNGEGGLYALTGYGSVRELAAAEETDPRVQAALSAFVSQVAAAVGQQALALTVRPQAIVLAGPLARWDTAMKRLEDRLSWMSPVFVIPGDPEFDAVAQAAGRALMGWAPVSVWPPVTSDEMAVGGNEQAAAQMTQMPPQARQPLH